MRNDSKLHWKSLTQPQQRMSDFKSVQQGPDNITYLKASEMKVGEETIGKYVGCEMIVNSTYGKNQFLYKLETEQGPAILYSTAQLEDLFKQVSEGDLVRLVYQGKQKVAHAKNLAHCFDFSVAKG